MNRARIVILALGFAFGAALPAHAAGIDDTLVSCARMANNAKRLACYDAAVATISNDAKAATAQREAEMAVLAAEQAKADEAAKKAAFGGERLARGQVPAGTITRVDAKVTEVLTASDGMAVLVLDNGQMWRQTTGVALPPVRNGDVVVITVASMGSFQAELVRQHRAFKVKRIK
ncbi:hypothetical protein [Polymorphobacter arshaanensis]|nr:hypothetical protein [Polymorphobacter arshaanensis]